MVRSLRYLLLLLSTVVSSHVFAQTGGIEGIVKDESGELLLSASVQVTEGGIVKGGTATDLDGRYVVKPLSSGRYDVRVTFVGYTTELVQEVVVVDNQNTTVNITLTRPKAGTTTTGPGGKSTNIGEVTVRATRYTKPLIEPTQPGSRTVLTDKDIEKMAVRDLASQVATTAGVLKGREGGLNLSGGREENTVYIIDGVLQTGSRATNLPPGSVGSISVYTGGLPARYGDATGGVISVTTKGVTSKLQGSVGGEQSIDGYGNSRAYFNLSGPILRRTDSNGNKRSLLGFTLNGDYQYLHDEFPSYYNNYVVKQEVLDALRAEPIRAVTDVNGTTYRNAAEYVTKADLETQKRRVNSDIQRATLLGKLDFQVADNINLTLGAQATGSSGKNYNRAATLFAPESIGTTDNATLRGYLRFTQRFTNRPNDTSSLISNAFYTVQADYQKELTRNWNPDFKTDIFKYGYLGKFYEDITTQYVQGTDPTTGKTGIIIPPGKGITSNARFERSELNPILANYTSILFDKYDIKPQSIYTGTPSIRSFNGLLNGDRPANVYTDWQNVGTPLNGYSKVNNDQVSVGVDASLDLRAGKNRHAIEFGLYYQQRTERSYSTGSSLGGTNSLWERARLLTNSHLNQYDYNNPIFVVNGQRYTKADVDAGRINPGPTDTILYNYLYVESAQSTFDANLRQRLGLTKDNTDFINVDSVDVNKMSLDLFSPDELFNNGSPFVNYSGFDYLGNMQSGSVSFNDFFTKKDANGRYTRPIGAFRPNYIAGYIQDNFELGKARFNVGVRVDRYDANTRVLKDPYSLYETIKVNNLGAAYPAQIRDENGNVQGIPSTIGSDYVVYVDNNSLRTPRIVGFRSGDDWYDPSGQLIGDPTTLKTLTGGRNPEPYQIKNTTTGRVTDIKDASYDPNSSFTDYTPQVNVMPRLSMSFPIQDQTLFYAHYDVIVQRPRGFVFSSPLDYYFMANQTGAPIINNPNLLPEKLVDYEFGFQQALTRRTAITLSLFYKERRDQIQVRPYLYASPTTYYTFGNRDFSTTKGLRVKYDFRRTGPLQFNLAYTLQFAEGTGSNVASSNRGRTDVFLTDGQLSNLISASLPNARNPYALDYDARHNIVLNADYRYFDGEDAGPMIFGYRPFRNAGANLIATAISGAPYNRYEDPVTTTIIGQPFGSRLPWRFQLDLSLDKDVVVKRYGNKVSDQTGLSGARAPLVMNFFINIRNLLNTRQILGVYGYTQDPRDNGFLQHPLGQQAIANQTYAPSYIDLYGISRDAPGNFALPRMMNVGFRFNF
ncbi:MAG: TonB-dependent receptor [Sphingobacteriales bacterium]|nr:MAG: TonB-dependent receptor [Sphingobacteriales bacterium]